MNSAMARVKLDPGRYAPEIHQVLADKGFNPEAVAYNPNLLAISFSDLVLRRAATANPAPDIYHGIASYTGETPTPTYTGLGYENYEIDLAIKAGSNGKNVGVGSAKELKFLRGGTFETPAIVLGAGPAGILVGAALRQLGYIVTIVDKVAEFNGIWRQSNVVGLSRNNPFNITVFDRILKEAPGSGESVKKFLDRSRSGLRIHQGKVVQVIPGDLHHTVVLERNGGTEILAAPIVVNCLGGGKPLPASNRRYITNDGNPGIRWQQVITPQQAKELNGKTLVFVGLGNSTAEMMVQIERYQRQGVADINYFVLTHYPIEALENPSRPHVNHGRRYRVFRDLDLPVLSKLAGDMPETAAAYFHAMYERRIIPSVRSWKFSGEKTITVQKRNAIRAQRLACDQIYTLIGYGQDPAFLEQMGLVVTDRYKGSIAADYDGEIRANPDFGGRARVYPGYFALGAMLKSGYDPNAEVIPGIVHRLHDMLFTIGVRGQEFLYGPRR